MTTSNSYQKYKVELFAEIINDWNYFCKKLHLQCLTVVWIHLCDYSQAEARFSTMLFPSKSDGRLYLIIAAPWWSGYHTTAQLHSTKSEHRFCAGSSLLAAYWRFRLGKIFEMVLAGNKAKCLSLVNHTTKTWWWSSSDITIKNNIMSIIFLANNF